MNDVAYVQSIASTRTEAASCSRCAPPVLCARHAADLTALRRQRQATLLRRPPASPVESQAA